MKSRGTWASDGAISVPQPLDTTNTEMADFEGFCFTPDGIRINISHSERESLISDGFAPQGVSTHASG